MGYSGIFQLCFGSAVRFTDWKSN